MYKQSYAEMEKGFAWPRSTLHETLKKEEEYLTEKQWSVQMTPMAYWMGT